MLLDIKKIGWTINLKSFEIKLDEIKNVFVKVMNYKLEKFWNSM